MGGTPGIMGGIPIKHQITFSVYQQLPVRASTPPKNCQVNANVTLKPQFKLYPTRRAYFLTDVIATKHTVSDICHKCSRMTDAAFYYTSIKSKQIQENSSLTPSEVPSISLLMHSVLSCLPMSAIY